MRFLMVDRILNMVPGKSIEAIKVIPPSEELFKDHFPGFPVIPGVLLTEMLAQASGKCLYAEDNVRGYPILLKIKEASFRKWAEPGQSIHLYAEVSSSKQDYATVKCHAKVKDKKICSVELLFGFIEKDKFACTEIPEIFTIDGQNYAE
jgi:3-hydroxyacyl-[acyl-carrier-protein] dehydratase